MNLRKYIYNKLKKEGKEHFCDLDNKVFFFEGSYKEYLSFIDLSIFKDWNYKDLKRENTSRYSKRLNLIYFYIGKSRKSFFYEIDKENNNTILNLIYKREIRKRTLEGIFICSYKDKYILTRDSEYTYCYTIKNILLGEEPKKIPYQINIDNINSSSNNSFVIDDEKFYYDENFNLMFKFNLKEKKFIFLEELEYKLPKNFNIWNININYLNNNYVLKNNYIEIFLYNQAKSIIKITYDVKNKKIITGKATGVPGSLIASGLYNKNNKAFKFDKNEKFDASRRNYLFKNKEIERNLKVINITLKNSQLSGNFELRLLKNNELFLNDMLINTSLENIKLLNLILKKTERGSAFSFVESLGIYFLKIKQNFYLFDDKFKLINFKFEDEMIEGLEIDHYNGYGLNIDDLKYLNFLKYEFTEDDLKRIKLLIKTGA